jgi:2-polyprenyl-3-methyl-5-hydroxy-6-metoxy-1,4-benzoquinol methylase
MSNIEYGQMAKYYDIFYKNKDYKREVEFLSNILKDKETILDVGCGTGEHMKYLIEKGYEVEGMDLDPDILEIAHDKTNAVVYNQNVLELDIDNKYDAIISMFAVMNHLKNNIELKKALENFRSHLNHDGIVVIDLHNPQKSGKKKNNYKEYTRIMEWKVNNKTKKEKTDITYIIDGKEIHTSREFKIFDINKIKEIANELGFIHVNTFANYTQKEGIPKDKNLQLVFKKAYKLKDKDNKTYASETKGTFGGHRKLKIYGRLNCPSALSFIAKGQYTKQRVFFKDEQTAIQAGYRPCAKCMKKEYNTWKNNNKS